VRDSEKKTRIALRGFFLALQSIFWIVILGFEFLIWNPGLRAAAIGESAAAEMVASFFNDLLWLPAALVLPWYVAQLSARIAGPRWLKKACILAGAALFALSLLSLPDTFRHLYALFIPFFALVLYSLIRRLRLDVPHLFYLLVLIAMVINYGSQLLPHTDTWRPRSSDHIKLLTYNIRLDESDENKKEAIQAIATELPDIVFIQEMNKSSRQQLARLNDLYPHQIWSDRRTFYSGGVILSRIPFERAENIPITTRHMDAATNLNHAAIRLDDRNIKLYNCHLFHGAHELLLFARGRSESLEVSAKAYRRHRDEAEMIARRLFTVDEPVILAGDLNDTPNSPVYRLLISRLQNSYEVAGWGLGTTYGIRTLRHYAPAPLEFLAFDFLRIDHIFCSLDFEVLSARVLALESSDHRPLLVTLRLAD